MTDFYRHGGAADRGSSDAYYQRGCCPHYYKGATYASERVEEENMTPEEVDAYVKAYVETREDGNFKQWD